MQAYKLQCTVTMFASVAPASLLQKARGCGAPRGPCNLARICSLILRVLGRGPLTATWLRSDQGEARITQAVGQGLLLICSVLTPYGLLPSRLGVPLTAPSHRFFFFVVKLVMRPKRSGRVGAPAVEHLCVGASACAGPKPPRPSLKQGPVPQAVA